MNKSIIKYKSHLQAQGRSLVYFKYISHILSSYNVDIESITNEQLDDIICNMIDSKKYKKETINIYIKSINSYTAFLNINIKPLKLLKVDKKIPQSINIEEFEDTFIPLLEEFRQYEKLSAMFYFWFFTGLRIGELLILNRGNIDLEKRVAKIYSPKTKEEKYVLFPAKVSIMLKRYFETETEKNNAFNITRPSINYIFRQLKPYFKDVNLKPHLFRHSCATHLLGKLDVSLIQEQLGHKNIQTTLIYLNRDIKKRKEIYDKQVA